MAMRLTMAFDHVPAGQTLGNILAYCDYPLALGGSASVAKINNYQWLLLSFLSAGTPAYPQSFSSYASMPLASAWDTTKARSYCGFRLYVSGNGRTWGGFTTYPLFAMYSGSTYVGLINLTDFNFVVGTEYYVEVMVDWVNKTRTVWVDGALVVSASAITIPAAPLSFQWWVGEFSATNASYGGAVAVTHLYFLDDAGDAAADSQRQGPLVANPITVADAAGTGWTSSDNAGLLADLNTPITSTTDMIAPYTASPGDGTPMDLHLTTAADPTLPVKIVTLMASTARIPGAVTATKTVVSDGTRTQRLPDQTYASNSMGVNKTLGNLTTALDGTSLTVAKLKQLKVSLSAITPGT